MNKILIRKFIITVTKYIRHSKNDDINSAFDSVLDDCYYEKDYDILMDSIEILSKVIKQFPQEFSNAQLKTLNTQIRNIKYPPFSADFDGDVVGNYEGAIFRDPTLNFKVNHE